MFIYERDAGMYLAVDSDSDRYHAQLPSGAYKIGRSDSGWLFKPADLRTERYVPIDSREARQIRREVAAFFDAEIGSRLQRAGIARRRGIIIHGEPGTGKTSLVMNLVPEMLEKGAVVLIDCNADPLENHIIPAIRKHDPGRPIVCIWDEFDRNANYSHAELLRLLDGTGSCDMLLCIGMTNHLDRIPTNLRLRPSRFGLVIEMPPPSIDLRKIFLTGQFGEVLTKEEIETAIQVTEGMSMDHVKEAAILMLQGHDSEDIRLRLKSVTMGDLKSFARTDAPDGDDE